MSQGERHDIDRPNRDDKERESTERHSAPQGGPAQERAIAPQEEGGKESASLFKDKARFTGLMSAIAARAGGLAPTSSRVPASEVKTDRGAPKDGACTDNGEPCPRKADAAKRAAVAVRFTTHDFLRLRLAAAELETPAHEIIVSALNAYLDKKGVERFDECLCLRKTANMCEEIASSVDEKD